jgi:hypothetical protein
VFSFLTLMALAFTLVAVAPRPAHAADSSPKEWDAKLVPVVHQVEQLRGLTFERPVKVEYLSDAAFQKRVRIDQGKLSKREKAEIARSEASLRATGLVAGDVDLLESTSDLQESGVLAYYDPKAKRVTVRGTSLDVATRVTLAHELTHALQDQHFDLVAMQRAADKANASSSAQALIEGDASRIEHAYLEGMPEADRADYGTWQRDKGVEVDTQLDADDVPGALLALFQSPYVLGPEMLRVLIADKGDAAVDDLFRHPPTTDVSYLDPRSVLHARTPAPVPLPTLGTGERQVGKRDTFGAFALYLVLATGGDPVRALEVADGWGGDSMLTFTRDGTTCIRAAFVGTNADASVAIHDALVGWATTRSGDTATVDADGERSTLTTCDRGDATADPGETSQAALITAAFRSALLAESIGVAGEEGSSCVAERVLHDPAFGPVLAAAVADPNAELDGAVSQPFMRSITTAAAACAARTGA